MPGRHCGLRLQVHDRLGHVHRGRIGGGVGARDLRHDRRDLGDRLDRRVLLLRRSSTACGSEIAGSVTGMNIRSPSFSGGMNSLPIRGTRATAPAMTRTAAASVSTRCRSAQPSTGRYTHTSGRITGFDSSPRIRAADEQAAEHRHQRDRQERGPRHGEGLGEGQRVEELALLAGQREHRDEGQDDDRHREEDRPADEPAWRRARSRSTRAPVPRVRRRAAP